MKKRIAILMLAAVMLVLAVCGSKAMMVPSAADGEQIQETAEANAQAVCPSLAGNYQDSVGQRATMNIQQTDDGLVIQVYWASSAFQGNEWNMTAVLTGDNKLEYTDCTQYEITYREDGENDTKVISSNQKGYFTIEDGKLLWNGAADETCKACVFELIPEYAGVYRHTWSEEIGGTVAERNAYLVLNEDGTGCWILQDIGTVTWTEGQMTDSLGLTYNIALTQENGTVNLLVTEFQDNPTVYEKIDKLPAEVEAMIAEA